MIEPGGDHYGIETIAMLEGAVAEGMQRGVLLMRHSARTFDRAIHDLLNPLTDHGRVLCDRFGEALPKSHTISGYASPPERCVETAERAIAAHVQKGGRGLRTRPLEALGVFYALDQRKMWKGLTAADGLADYVGQWFAGRVPSDAMMPSPLAARRSPSPWCCEHLEASSSGRSKMPSIWISVSAMT